MIEALRPTSGAGEWVLASRNHGKRLANLRPSNQRLLDLTGIEPRFAPHLDSGSVRATYQRHGNGPEMRRALTLLGDRIEAMVTGRSETSNIARIA